MAGTSNFGNLLSDAANGAATLEKISQLGMLNDIHGEKKKLKDPYCLKLSCISLAAHEPASRE